MSHTIDSTASDWAPVVPRPATAVSEARLQLHQAAQVANAAAISYLEPAADDSHTNFGWSADLRAFVSRRVSLPKPLRFAWRPADFALLALDDAGTVATLGLAGHTLDQAHRWARGQCEAAGGDGGRYTARKHYEIPAHAVAAGANFSADSGATGMLSELWSNASRFLDAFARSTPGSSEVRLWPHHFDQGLIVEIDAARSIGCGFTPGDHYYDEPYWYMSPYPQPAPGARPVLAGGAHWHETDFVSAVLPWSAFAGSVSQGAAVAAYLRMALQGARSLLGV